MTEEMVPFFVGSTIAAIRRGRDMTQAELAEKAGLNISFLGQVERGEKNPTIKTLYKISEALNISMASLVSVNPIPNNDIEDAKFIARLLRCIKPEILKLVFIDLEGKS